MKLLPIVWHTMANVPIAGTSIDNDNDQATNSSVTYRPKD